ncbi:Protein of unknown function DUF1399 [Kalmanozyma brasiliensis GHG001]|uniref:Uncharacterized protein n=1 Tax=Kalmanozyma brasiliensis (strain GHG001) TaxID=1365824 RepID=V5GP79_KALBG|nr:Protein of unknown function DUF1399 [Kalmanozyma brasiliensis GHG001]EST07767.1 Protein of unknown function DUF1399 [Kalmanozyma brasiliensis GHG001]
MARTTTPPLSNGSTSSSDDSPSEQQPTSSHLPDYGFATGSAPQPSTSADVEKITATLQSASIKICDGPGLTPEERKELEKALQDGVRVGLINTSAQRFCSLDRLKDHLKLLDLFDRLREAVHKGTEYFDYPSCHQDAGHIDEPGIDAPPPPYAPAADPVPQVHPKTGLRPTKEEADKAAAELSQQLLQERRWNIFLNRAAYRVELWCQNVLSSSKLNNHYNTVLKPQRDQDTTKAPLDGFDLPDFALPPIDVALMLHAYHLNPLHKEEDTQRLRSRYNLFNFDYPLRQLAQRAHSTLPILNNVEPAKTFWNEAVTAKRSKQPWDLSLQPPPGHPTHAQETYGGSIFGLSIDCPRCKTSQFIPWTGVGDKPQQLGLGETGWQRTCSDQGCGQSIAAEHLQMRRFLDHYALWRTSTHRPQKVLYPEGVFWMAGTKLADPHRQNVAIDNLGGALLEPIFRSEKPCRILYANRYVTHKPGKGHSTQEITEIAEQCDYNFITFRKWFEDRWMSDAVSPRLNSDQAKGQQMARIAAVMRCYQTGNAAAFGEASCDLVDAVKRQTSFNKEMEKLGWSKHPDLLDQGALDDVLSRSLIRYYKFLDLMASTHTLLTPTLDIDLCWHTHQLQAKYYDQSFRLVGRFINHDDAIETGILKNAFDVTATLWKDRYGQPFSLCGCIYNNPGTVKKLKGFLGGNSTAAESSDAANEKSSGFASRLKGKWRAAKALNGDQQDHTTHWQDATHPSAHQAVIVKEAEESHDKLREQMVKEWAQGKRREGHESAFVFGYNTPGLYPFYHSPLYSTHVVSRGSTGDAVNAYTTYGAYGLMAVSMNPVGGFAAGYSLGLMGAAGVGCGGGGGGCGGGGGGC